MQTGRHRLRFASIGFGVLVVAGLLLVAGCGVGGGDAQADRGAPATADSPDTRADGGVALAFVNLDAATSLTVSVAGVEGSGSTAGG